jgi:hypothetical protein
MTYSRILKSIAAEEMWRNFQYADDIIQSSRGLQLFNRIKTKRVCLCKDSGRTAL